MANTSEEMAKKLQEAFKLIADHSKKTEGHWHQVANSIDDITAQFNKGFLGVFGQTTGFHTSLKAISSTLSSSFRGSNEHLSKMQSQLDELVDKADSLRGFSTHAPSAEFEKANKQAIAYRAVLGQHVALTSQVGQIMSSKWTPALLGTVGALESSVKFSHMLNVELIKASSDAATRSRLMGEIAKTQMTTGADLQHTGKAAAALVNYGVHLRDNFKETLDLVVKMEEGLGSSFETSAQMVVSVQRIGGSVQKVADGIARVKADTALAADEAAKFATQISQAVMMLKPGSGSLVDQTSEYINRLAGALKELTGSGGDIVNMLSSFTTEAGMMGAATLGATPDFLASPEQTKKVTERFVKYVDTQLAGTKGFQRMATVTLLAEQFNTTASVVSNARAMMEKFNETQRNSTKLQEEWRNQTSEISKVFDRMFRSIGALLHAAVLPALQLLRPSLAFVADLVQKLSNSTTAIRVTGGLLLAGTVMLTYQLGRLAMRMALATAAARVYEAQMDLPGLGRAGGGVTRLLSRWLPGITGYLARLSGFLTGGVVAAGLSALAVGVGAGMAINKFFLGKDFGEQIANAMRSKKDLYQSQASILGSGRHTRQELLEHVSSMVNAGKGAKEIQDYIMANIASVKGMHAFEGPGSTKEFREKAVMGIIEDVGRIVTRQRVRMGLTGLTTQTTEEQATQARLISLYEQIAKNTALTTELLKKTETNHERRNDLHKQQTDEVDTEERLRRSQKERSEENYQRF